MSVILSVLRAINTQLSRIATMLAMLIVAIMVAALTASAATRFVSGTGYDWLIELPPALVPWLVFPLLGPLLRTGEHIQVDLLPTFLRPRHALYLSLFTYSVMLIGAVIFMLAGQEAVTLFRQLGQIMELEFEIPIWWMYLAFPVGFGILALFAFEMFLATLQALISGDLSEEGCQSA
ncbi:TRAP transporter small permease [Hoeflea sp. TYP-13]|uniref:TRAP transporter small permease n=1 Tax=Hoeflea sp. TYP-13 TaxID=3230023 RepID=UPI0034C637D3